MPAVCNQWVKGGGCACAGLILLILAVCLLPLPRSLDVTHQAMLWRCGTPKEQQLTELRLTGIYYDYLFREDAFSGSIRVEACPETHGDLSVVKMGSGQYGIWSEDEEALMKAFGSMFVRKDGSVMVIVHEDGHWDAETGLMITAPASTREEALALTNELADELSPKWLGVWTFE